MNEEPEKRGPHEPEWRGRPHEPVLGPNSWVLIAIVVLIAVLYTLKTQYGENPIERCTTYPQGVICKIIG